MKARINYRSKRTIIIISIAVVLLIAAIAGTVAFVKGNRDSAAAMTDDNPVTSQNDGTNAGLPNNGDQNNGSDQNNDGTTLPTDGDNTNPADSNNNDNNGSTTNDGTTGTNGANGSTTGTTNGANTGANAGTSTGTTTAGNNGANVPNQDYAQTTTVITENPWETKEIGWSPISVAAYTAASKLKVHKPDLDLQKYAYLDGDSLEELPVNTAAQKGETITYVIKITNKGNEDTNGIRTIDSIPEGTELASISEGGALNNDGKIVWKNDIKAGETVTVSFKVVVTADSIDLINNIAKVNGEETPETKTPVITANKTAQVVTKVDKEEVLENRDAKVGETIRYTITAKNTTEVDGTTVIKDSIPDGTSFVDGTITEKGNFDKENGTITWNNVVVPAKGEVSVSFDVVVNEKTTAGEVVKSVSNTATIGNTPTEEVETKVANITGTKSVDKTEAKVGETLTYTITLTNSGNGDGKVTVTDRVPEGTTIKDSEINGYDSKTNIMTWKDVEVKAGKSVELTFEVIVNDNTSIIKNKAYVDENKIPEEPETSVKHHYTVEHYTENLDGTYSKVEKDTVVSEDVEIGTKVSYKINNYDGFTFDESKTENKDSTVPDNNNLIVKLYYARRNDLSYTVYYKEQGTEKELAGAKVVDGQTFGDVVTENAIDIDGYNKVNPTSADITITTGTNEYTFYYTKRNDLSYTVYYKEQGTENELADAKLVNGQKFGDVVTENAIDIDGYNKVNPTNANITITTGKNEYTFYYTKRNDLSYTVYYKEQGTENELADAKVVNGQKFGDVVTENAIDIDGYNKVNPTSANITITTGKNEYTFYYTKRNDLSYTVNYLEKGTNNVLHEAKTVGNQTFGAEVTASVTNNAIEKPEAIDGYNCVEVDKETLTIGTSTNEINFYYTKRTDLSYTVNYLEKGTNNVLHEAKTVGNQTFGAEVTASVTNNAIEKPEAIDGYNCVEVDKETLTIGTSTNEINFYYTKRTDLSYTVNYLEKGTNNVLHEAKTVGNQTFGAEVTASVTNNAIEKPEAIDGYNCVEVDKETLTIGTSTNEINFYYTKRTDLSYTVNYLEKGTNNVLHEAKTVGNQTFGAEVTASVTNNAIEKPEAIDGYNCVEVDKETLTIGTSTNEINFYYTKRTDLSYTVNYLEKGTNNVLHEAKTVGNQTFGAEVTASVTNNAIEKPEAIDGYNCVEVDKETLTIGTSTNEINFYYTKRTDLSYTVNYYYNGELKHSVTFDNMEYLDEISGVEEMPKYNGVTYTKYDLKTSSANGLLPLIIGTGSNYINVYYGTPNVTISKKVNKTAVKVGDTLHYTIKVTETRGFVDASGVNVTDPISEGLENVRNITHNGKLNEGNVEWNNLAITKNSSITLEFDATVSAATIGKTISNTANLGGTMSGDSNTVTTTVSELKAAVKEVKKGTTGKDAVNIVLVMDLSYSMKSNKTSDGVTRLDAAKTAATKFINSIYTKDPKSKVTVTVLTFNTANPLTTIKYVGTERCTNNNIWHLHLNCKNIDGVWYSNWKEQKVAIPYSGTSKLGFADKTNYGALVNEINNISLPAENPDEGLGTNVSAALDLTKTTIGDLKDNHSENSNVVILLSDGAPTTSYSGNSSWNNYEGLRNQASEIKGNPITTEFYSIQFGTEDGAYDLLRAMSSNNTVYTSNSIDSLVKNFTNILDQNTTKDPIDTVNGKYTTTLSNPLVVDADNPITVTYKGTTLFTCTSLPNNGLTYDSTTKTISWDINAWNAVEGHTKVTTNDIVIQCYVER